MLQVLTEPATIEKKGRNWSVREHRFGTAPIQLAHVGGTRSAPRRPKARLESHAAASCGDQQRAVGSADLCDRTTPLRECACT